jgi:hypothetical protein
MPKTTASPAVQLADRILRAAQKAQSEEDLKIAVESALAKALTALGVEATPDYEKLAAQMRHAESVTCANELSELEREIDRAAAELWSITPAELEGLG